jgi:uncharacterized membrane protein YraQ (UPF0718 family)
MGFVLGWQWTILRIVVGCILVFGVAYAANRFVTEQDVPPEAEAAWRMAAEGDGGTSMWVRWGKAIWRLFVGLVPEYLVIVLLLGAARAWLFPTITPAIGHSPWLVVALAAAGTLFVVPTAGEIPVVQTLLSFGLGAAAAGALLTTLPPVSLPSLAMLARAFPLRILVFVAVTVFALGILSGVAAVGLGL